jgi:hypothetical protein
MYDEMRKKVKGSVMGSQHGIVDISIPSSKGGRKPICRYTLCQQEILKGELRVAYQFALQRPVAYLHPGCVARFLKEVTHVPALHSHEVSFMLSVQLTEFQCSENAQVAAAAHNLEDRGSIAPKPKGLRRLLRGLLKAFKRPLKGLKRPLKDVLKACKG